MFYDDFSCRIFYHAMTTAEPLEPFIFQHSESILNKQESSGDCRPSGEAFVFNRVH